ncbi:LINE-1 retrotransposable element orf2 protein [Plakobranchus ocellatus]|uniref:LINE-1 retrotransposable element orf2 protein n=1 Tax=Plakobranchus ocellatus TaxID=259542 RepID=A0AAV4ANV5_9GAST|nr:LINE-1 retrotransposable element orf2 protein [Plakobranchus ocellatus]
MKNNFAGPPIMKEEVETAIKKMKHGKATGPDNISVELIEALEDFGIGKVTHLLNEIYDTGQIPTDLSKSIFIALPKKPGATECELHRTISLMSHITKILLKIIMLRIRNKIKPEIAEEQCGFVEDKGTSNAIWLSPPVLFTKSNINVKFSFYFHIG